MWQPEPGEGATGRLRLARPYGADVVEQALCTRPAVAEYAVIGVPDAKWARLAARFSSRTVNVHALIATDVNADGKLAPSRARRPALRLDPWLFAARWFIEPLGWLQAPGPFARGIVVVCGPTMVPGYRNVALFGIVDLVAVIVMAWLITPVSCGPGASAGAAIKRPAAEPRPGPAT